MVWRIVLFALIGVCLLWGALWWWRTSRQRCPIDGSVRCRHCVHDQETPVNDTVGPQKVQPPKR